MITVYTRPGCGACTATKLWLEKHGIEFEEVRATDPGPAVDLGYTQLPVVVAGTDHWSGFRIEKLAALKTHHPGDNSGVIDG